MRRSASDATAAARLALIAVQTKVSPDGVKPIDPATRQNEPALTSTDCCGGSGSCEPPNAALWCCDQSSFTRALLVPEHPPGPEPEGDDPDEKAQSDRQTGGTSHAAAIGTLPIRS